MRRALIAGNWKLNGLHEDLGWIDKLGANPAARGETCDIALCLPATLLRAGCEKAPGWLKIGAQDCSGHNSGAHTGEVSAAMLADAGARYVIVGHSERRADHAETDGLVRQKAARALEAGLTPIICIGESLEQRERGEAEAVCRRQMLASLPDASASQIVIAYEPVWAIGTGRTASAEDAQATHQALRAVFPGKDRDALRIVYGGSVKPENAEDLLAQPDIDGALVGGASLDADQFARIIAALK
jgi:triosephosphate isomerase